MRSREDDSTGKGKIAENKVGSCAATVICNLSCCKLSKRVSPLQARNTVMLSIFVVGLCIGMIIAERVYISRGGRVPKPRFLQTHHDALQKIGTGNGKTVSKGGSITAKGSSNSKLVEYSDSAPPRNDLEELLRKIAPQKEVMVAVANKNVNWDGMLATFCKGVKDAGVTNHLILALDQETKDWCAQNGYNAYLLKLEVHAVRGCGTCR